MALGCSASIWKLPAHRPSLLLLVALLLLAPPPAAAAPLALALSASARSINHTWLWTNPSDRLSCRARRTRRRSPLDYPAILKERFQPRLPRPLNATSKCHHLNCSTPVAGAFSSGRQGPAFDLHACRLRRFTADEALSCLADKTVVWIGDSLTRYQALALAYWLANAEPQHPYDQATLPGHIPSVTNEHKWPSWDTFFRNVSEEMTDPLCMASRCVGCFRSSVSMKLQETFKWRFLLRSGATVRMAARTVLHVEHGPNGTAAAAAGTVGAAVQAIEWALNTSNFQPDLLIFNMGIWVAQDGVALPRLSAVLDVYETVFQRAAALVAAQQRLPRTRLVFKSTTPFRGQPRDPLAQNSKRSSWLLAWADVEPLVKAMAQWYGFAYLDVASVARAALQQGMRTTWDMFHFYPFMYHEFNNLLLNVLCH